MKHIVMPRLGLTMEQGTLLTWRINEGEAFQEGDIIFEIETDKVASEIEAPFSGKLIKILVPEGETVDVSTPVAEAEEGMG
jgi:pyruvate dehydrogenase E2 component (dihydrolipoamide acetyltransferase)